MSVSRGDVFRMWRAWVMSLPEELQEVDLQLNRRPRWVLGVWDCDNHALSFAEWLSRAHALTFQVEDDQRRGGIACAPWWYTAGGSLNRHGGHAACLVHDGEGVVAFEPYSGEFFEPTKMERASTRAGMYI